MSVQSNRFKNFIRVSMSTFGFSFFFVQLTQFFKDSCPYWGMILSFTKIFGCREIEGVVLLFWFVCSEYFAQISNHIRIPFRNHTEKCRVHRFDELGLLRSDYGEFTKLGVFLN